MAIADPIGDMITRIRNAQMRQLNKVTVPNSKFRTKVLDILKKEGFIINYKSSEDADKKFNILVELKYNNGEPVIKEIKRISKPGRRIYAKASSIPKIQNGLGLAIISTPQGVMSDVEARKNNIGGEVICRVF